jgi:hypothetical protein
MCLEIDRFLFIWIIHSFTFFNSFNWILTFKMYKDANLTMIKRLNFSGATNVSQLQKFIESNIVHRQGFTYGAEQKKQLSIFIDDINAPISDAFGVQRCNEVMHFKIYKIIQIKNVKSSKKSR